MDGDQADLTALVRLKKILQRTALCGRSPCIRRKGDRAVWAAPKKNRMHPGYRFPRGHLRQGSGVCGAYIACCRTIRSISSTGCEPSLHHGIASDKYCLDTVYRAETCRNAGPPRASGKNRPDTARSITNQGVRMPQRKPYRPLIIGPSADTVLCAELLQRHGFYALPVRPPRCPKGHHASASR